MRICGLPEGSLPPPPYTERSDRYGDDIRREIQAEVGAALKQHWTMMMTEVDNRIAMALRDGVGSLKSRQQKDQTQPTMFAFEGARNLQLTPRGGNATSELIQVDEVSTTTTTSKRTTKMENQRDSAGYTRLVQAENGDDGQVNSSEGSAWLENWLDTVDAGELDVYTCLGLSNAFTNTPDTRKIWSQAFAVSVLQLCIPSIMLFSEFQAGLTIHPNHSDSGFRFIGAVLYAYSVYTMYNNADGECRSSLLNMMMAHENISPGYWVPLIIGEVLNVFVAMILVLTLYQIYTHQNEPADLILNAVAVNFLGSVDSEFVSHSMEKEAVENCKEFHAAVYDPGVPTRTKGQADIEGAPKESWIDFGVRLVLYGVAFAGLIGSLMFMFISTAEHPHVHHGMRHAGIGMPKH